MTRLASVAVPVPQLDLLTYRIPDGIDTPVVGARVLVPVGARTITGCVTGTDEAAGDDPRALADGLRDIIDLLDGEAYLPADVVALAGWVADYYACGPGEAVGAAVPPMAWLESRRVVAITEEGSRAVAGGPGPPLSALARRVLETAAAARSLPESTLRTRLNRTAAGAAGARPHSRIGSGPGIHVAARPEFLVRPVDRGAVDAEPLREVPGGRQMLAGSERALVHEALDPTHDLSPDGSLRVAVDGE